MKTQKTKRRGAPKGSRNAAKPVSEHRVSLSTSVAPETAAAVKRLAKKHRGKGRVIDAAVALLEARS